MKRTCLICQTSFDTSTAKPEHILLDALGGKKTTRESICSKCNGDAGISIDQELANAVRIIRNLHNFRSGDGSAAPAVHGLPLDDGSKINLSAGGKPDDRKFNIEVLDSGTEKKTISIGVTGYDRLISQLPNIAKKAGVSVEQITEKIAENGLEIQNKPVNQFMHATLSIGGTNQMLAVAKMALVLWSLRVGNQEAAAIASQAIGRMIFAALKKLPAPAETVGELDARQPPIHRLPPEYDWGDFFNTLFVFDDGEGNIRAFFRLYNSFNFYIHLGTSTAPKVRSVLLLSNPETLNWCMKNDYDIGVQQSWMTPQKSNEDFKQAISKLLSTAQVKQHKSVQNRMIEDAIRDSFPAEGEVITKEHVDKLCERIAKMVVPQMYGMPYSQQISGLDFKKRMQNVQNTKKNKNKS